MTDKLKCCFCGEELEYDWYEYENGRGDTEYAKSGLLKCPDWDCRGYKLKLEPEIWQALIDGKKARDTLNYAIGVLDNLTEIGGVDMEIIKIKKMAGITKREK